jgi:F-type H+-transporting ATPase subunit a
MGLEFLSRIRRASLVIGGIATLMSAVYARPVAGLAVAAGCLWSLVNLALLERLVVALTGSDRESVRTRIRAGLALAGLIALFGAGAALLVSLPIAWLAFGFVIPLAVIVFKAASLLLIQSRTWARMMRHPRASGALLLVAIAAWAALAWAASFDRSTSELAQHHGAGAEAPGGHAEAPPAAYDTLVTPRGEAPAHDGGASPHGAAPTHEGGAEAHGGGHAEAEGPQKFANFITVLSRAFPDAGWAHFLHEFEVVIFSLLIALAICVLAGAAARKGALIPGRFQNAVEMLFEMLHNFIVGILGEKYGRRYVPFLGTLFIYILVMNLAGLIPFLESPTSSLNVTVALALTVFVFAQWIGFRELGVVGWFDHMAGTPRSLTQWLLVPLMLPIHIMGELAKPISLAARLFGNVFGEDMLLVAFVSLGITTLSFTGLPIGLPLHLPFLFLALLTGTLQALVFTVLSTIYFLLMLPHDDHGHEAEAHHAH